MELGFNHVSYLQRKARSTFNIERDDLHLKLPNRQSNIRDLLSANQNSPSHKKTIQESECIYIDSLMILFFFKSY